VQGWCIGASKFYTGNNFRGFEHFLDMKIISGAILQKALSYNMNSFSKLGFVSESQKNDPFERENSFSLK
jgi:hypothetical protein